MENEDHDAHISCSECVHHFDFMRRKDAGGLQDRRCQVLNHL